MCLSLGCPSVRTALRLTVFGAQRISEQNSHVRAMLVRAGLLHTVFEAYASQGGNLNDTQFSELAAVSVRVALGCCVVVSPVHVVHSGLSTDRVVQREQAERLSAVNAGRRWCHVSMCVSVSLVWYVYVLLCSSALCLCCVCWPRNCLPCPASPTWRPLAMSCAHVLGRAPSLA